MAGRILNYIYVGMELAVVPTYQSEIGVYSGVSLRLCCRLSLSYNNI